MEGKQASKRSLSCSLYCSFSNYLWDSFGTQHRLRCYAASSEWCADSRKNGRTDCEFLYERPCLPCCCLLLPAHFNTWGKRKTIPELAQLGERSHELKHRRRVLFDLSHRCSQSVLREQRLSIKNLRFCNPRIH